MSSWLVLVALATNPELRIEAVYVVALAVSAIAVTILWCCAFTFCCVPRVIRQLTALVAIVLCIGTIVALVVLLPTIRDAIAAPSDWSSK